MACGIQDSLSFVEAKNELEKPNVHICYDVHMQFYGDNYKSHGALMQVNGYIESVESYGFMDYDGHGDQVSNSGEYLGGTYPSDVKNLHKDCKYILWYNK